MCVFCNKLALNNDIIYQNENTFVIYDNFPVSKGHCLIITKRHIESFFEATKDELRDISDSIEFLKTHIEQTLKPDGYNIGVNIGSAAGQTIMHLHVHVIPRFRGDCIDPRGGIRGCIPGKRIY